MPRLEEAETTLRAAVNGVECDADAVLAAQMFLELTATGKQVRPDDLHMTDVSLPVCEDSHLPDYNVPTTAEEADAEAAVAGADTTACDASRGGTLTLCKDPPARGGKGTNCVVIGEYTGPPE